MGIIMAAVPQAAPPTLVPDPDPRPWYTGPNGATNYTRHEVQRWARSILQNPLYRARVEKDAIAGTLPTAIEVILYHYGYGKPMEQIQLTMTQEQEDLSTLSMDELHQRAKDLADALEEARQIDAILPAQYKVA